MSRIDPIDSFARRLTALIRGPARLREDIADEIADHLSTRIEEDVAHGGKSVDPAMVEAQAIVAFGDPQKIARELRHIHLGDWIMFQRIMVAALVVIVVGMAATAYFSWSAARQQSQQFAKMNDQLASLVELQKQAANHKTELPPNDVHAPPEKQTPTATAQPQPAPKPVPPQTRIQFVAGPDNKPVPGYKVAVEWMKQPSREERVTDEQGCISLTNGLYRLSGLILDTAGRPREHTGLSRIIEVEQMPGSTKQVQIDVSPRTEYDVRFDVSAVSWDLKVARRLRVRFEQHTGRVFEGQPGPEGRVQHSERAYSSEWYTVSSQEGPANRITGLYPGPVKAHVKLLPGPDDIIWKDDVSPEQRAKAQEIAIWSWDVETSVPEQSGPIIIKLAPKAEQKLTAVLFDGSRNHPLANQSIRLVCPLSIDLGASATPTPPGRPSSPMRRPSRGTQRVVVEYLVTNSRGEFTAATTGDLKNPPLSAIINRPYIVTQWHTANGKPADFVWPLSSDLVKSYQIEGQGTLYELDASQIATLRLVFGGADKLLGQGLRFVGPVQIGAPNAAPMPPLPSHWQSVDCLAGTIDPLSKTTDLLLIASEFSTELSMIIAETKADAPEMESHKFYRRSFEQLKTTAGQVTEVPIPLDQLDKWKLEKTEWHKRDVPTTQTQPTGK